MRFKMSKIGNAEIGLFGLIDASHELIRGFLNCMNLAIWFPRINVYNGSLVDVGVFKGKGKKIGSIN